MKKKFRLPMAMVMSMMLAFGLAAAPVAAASAPKIEEIDYEGKGKVEVEFYGKVSYSDASVAVKDTSGNKYTAKIVKKDNDDITFKIKKYKTGTTYKFTINGISKRGSGDYTSVSGKVKIPASGKVKVKSVDYDASDREVEFELKGKVRWKKPTVTITDANGNNCCTGILEKDSDSIEVSVKKLTLGDTYSYKITGVKNRDGGSYKTVTGTFSARDND